MHALVEQGRRNTIALYREVERRLGDEWAAGNAYSIADMYLVPFHELRKHRLVVDQQQSRLRHRVSSLPRVGCTATAPQVKK